MSHVDAFLLVAVLDQQLGDVVFSFEAGEVEGRALVVVDHVQAGALVQQQVCNFEVSVCGCIVKRCTSKLVFGL